MLDEATEMRVVTGKERWFWSSAAVTVIAYWLAPPSDHAGSVSHSLSFSTSTFPPLAINSGASHSSRVTVDLDSTFSGSAMRVPSAPESCCGSVTTIERGSTMILAEAVLEIFPSLSVTVTSTA